MNEFCWPKIFFCIFSFLIISPCMESAVQIPIFNYELLLKSHILSIMLHYLFAFASFLFLVQICDVCVTVSAGILAFTYSVVSPQRTITKLTLMKGGHHLRVETYLFMHFRRHFEVPLEMVSCSRARDVKQSSHNLMNLKIKGRKLYFQVDKKDGKFLEPTLFDFAVALKRF